MKKISYTRFDFISFSPAGFSSATYDVRLNTDKIDARLIPYFKGIASELGCDGFLKLPKEIANGYMFFLSKTISSRRAIAKLTDNPDMFSGMIYFDGNGHFDEELCDEKANEIFCTLMIETLIPADISAIKIESILSINKDLSVARNDFRKSINDFTERIRKIKDQNFANKEIERFKNHLTASNNSKKELFTYFGQKLISSSFFTGFPTFLTPFFADSSSITDSKILFTGAIASGVATIASAGEQTVDHWKSKQSNYYLQLKNILHSSSPSKIQHPNIHRLFNEFIND